MYQLHIYRSAGELPLPYYYQAQAFMRIAWGENHDYDIDLGLKEENCAYVILAQGNRLISYCEVNWRTITHAGETYKCYGLSGVLTFPGFRKRGCGGQVVNAAGKLIREDQSADLALLWTAPHNASFYARYGWAAMPKLQTLIGEMENPTVYDDELPMMQFISSKGQAAREIFENGRVYVGEEQW